MSQKFNILLIEDSRIDSTKLLNRNVIATVSNKRLELVIDGKHRTEFKLKQLKISTNYTRNSCIITSDGLKLVMSDRSDVAKRFVKHLQDAIDGKLCDPSISNSNSSANYHKSDQKIYSNSDRSSQKRSGVADRNSLGNSHSKGSSTSGSASAKRIQQSETTVSSSRKAELSIDESPHNLKNVNSSAVKTSPIVSNYTDKNSNSANKSNSGKLLMKRKSDEFEMVITSPMKSYKRKLSAVSRTDDSDDDNIDEISAKKDNNSTNSTEKKDKDPLDDLQMDVVEPTQKPAITRTYGKKPSGTNKPMTSTASAWAQLGLVPSSKSTMLTVNSPGKDVQADDHVNHEINGANVYTKKESKLFKTFFGSSTNRANEEAKTPTKAANSDSTSKDNFTSDWKNRINSVKAHLTKTPLKATLTPSKIDLSCERKPILTGRLMGGIRNLGNSCYISSVLQAMLSIPEFRRVLSSPFWTQVDYFIGTTEIKVPLVESSASINDTNNLLISGRNDTDTEIETNNSTSEVVAQDKYQSYSLLRELVAIAKEHNDASGAVKDSNSLLIDSINPVKLKNTIEKITDHYHGYRQHDAHEFLSDFINAFHDELFHKIKIFLNKEESKAQVAINNSVPLYRNSFETPNDKNTMKQSFLKHAIGTDCSEDHSAVTTKDSNNPMVGENTSTDKEIVTDSHVSLEQSAVIGKQEEHNTAQNRETDNFSKMELTLPTHQLFHSALEINFECLHCKFKRESKVESYRDYSVDLDIENDNEPNLGTRKELDNVFSLVDENNNFDIINLESNTNKESMEENSGLILENLLANFFKDDVRELNCEKCKTKNGQSKVSSKMICVPNVLILHLKRFKYVPSMNDFVKNNCPVKFPSEFNLKQTINLKISSHKDDDNTEVSGSFQTSAAIGKLLNAPEKIKSTNGQISYIKNLETVWDTEPKVFVESNKSFLGKQLDCSRSVFDEEKENHKNYSVGEFDAHQLIYKNLTEEDCNYRLSAVIRHQGVVASAGHYICDVNSTVDNTKKSAWKRYNDAIVNYIDEGDVLEDRSSPYILVYRRVQE